MSKGKKSKQPKIENSQFDALINQLMSAEGAQKMKLLDALKQSHLNDLAVQQRKLDTADAVRNQLIAKNNKLEQKNVELTNKNVELTDKNKKLEDELQKHHILESFAAGAMFALLENYGTRSDVEKFQAITTTALEQYQFFISTMEKLIVKEQKLEKFIFGRFTYKSNVNLDLPAVKIDTEDKEKNPKDAPNGSPNSSEPTDMEGVTKAVQEATQSKARNSLKIIRGINNLAKNHQGANSSFGTAMDGSHDPEDKNTDKSNQGQADKNKGKSKGRGERKDTNLKTKSPIVPKKYEKLICPVCGELSKEGWAHIKKVIDFYESQSLNAAEAVNVSGTIDTYQCQNCGFSFDSPMENPPVFPKAQYDLASHVRMAVLSAMGLTINQSSKIMFQGLKLGHSTIDDNVHDCVVCFLTPVLKYFKEQLAQLPFIHADESPVKVLTKDGTSNRYMLQFTSPDWAPPIIIYQGPCRRNNETIHGALDNFNFYGMTTDGYSCYRSYIVKNKANNIIIQWQVCLSHFYTTIKDAIDASGPVAFENIQKQYKERFAEIIANDAIDHNKYVDCIIVLSRVANKLSFIFDVEQQAFDQAQEELKDDPQKDVKFIERYFYHREQLRAQKSKQYMEDIDALMNVMAKHFAEKKNTKWQAKAGVSKRFADPVVYYLNNREELRAFLQNPRLDVTNMIAERHFRILARFRKVSPLIRSEDSQDLSIIMSLIATLTARGIPNPMDYLTDAAIWYRNNGCLKVKIQNYSKYWDKDQQSKLCERVSEPDYRSKESQEVYASLEFPDWLKLENWIKLSEEDRLKLRCDVSQVINTFGA